MTDKTKTREIGERAEKTMRAVIAVTDELLEVNQQFMEFLRSGLRYE